MSGKRHKKELWLDPRAKLFLILMCVLSSMFAPSLAYQFNNKIFPAILKMIISTSFSLRTVACRDLPLLYNSFQSLMAH